MREDRGAELRIYAMGATGHSLMAKGTELGNQFLSK